MLLEKLEPAMLLAERDLEQAILLWPQLTGATCRLINHSENHTFRFDAQDGRAFTLRVHRPDYQSLGNIESELAWLQALRLDTDLDIPETVAGTDGEVLQQFVGPDGLVRHAVLFRFIAGTEPSPESNLVDLFGVLGLYAARLHNHVTSWKTPAGFERQAWNAATILDADGLWGDWRIAPGVDGHMHRILNRASDLLRNRLAAYGQAPNRYGLIHADMRLGNLLVDGDKVTLIDFDDCGLCWFGYDFAAAISFHETHKAVPALRQAWVESYRTFRAFTDEDVAALDSMVLLRRMALLAWIGSHAETNLAQTHMNGFAEGTAILAENYLAGGLWP